MYRIMRFINGSSVFWSYTLIRILKQRKLGHFYMGEWQQNYFLLKALNWVYLLPSSYAQSNDLRKKIVGDCLLLCEDTLAIGMWPWELPKSRTCRSRLFEGEVGLFQGVERGRLAVAHWPFEPNVIIKVKNTRHVQPPSSHFNYDCPFITHTKAMCTTQTSTLLVSYSSIFAIKKNILKIYWVLNS